jgi:sensor histidine kinase regulating citrate/malate metabolism
MQEEDIYSLFGNALDNAIESLLSVEDAEKRCIGMKVVVNNKILSIHFDNYCEKPLTFRDELPVTTKDDKNYHGFGMLSIDYIVKKYKGTMAVSVVENMFNLNILIPLPKE